jgi:hypothetical protein
MQQGEDEGWAGYIRLIRVTQYRAEITSVAPYSVLHITYFRWLNGKT